MDVIQEVGSYAGFAAVVGLAVLAALYFSQARDVRRLREWAGRAPERAAEQAQGAVVTPEQTAQDAARPAPSGAVRPIPAAKPAAAAKAATGAKPETAVKPAAAGKPGATPATKPTPAGKPATATDGGEKPVSPPGAAPPVPATAAATASPATASGPAPATPAGAPAKAAPAEPSKGADGSPPTPAPGGPPQATPPPRPTPPPVVPARPAPPVRSPAAAAASQSTAVLPASSVRLRDRARRPTEQGLTPRYIALIVAGVIVIGGATAFGISQLGGDDGGSTAGDSAGESPQAPVNPSTVTVSVLNGTTVPGLAAQIGDEVESAGFQRGNVANALDQQRTSSAVLYVEGADREAKLVARKLGIGTVEPIDPDSQALGGNASVVVIVGADQTQ